MKPRKLRQKILTTIILTISAFNLAACAPVLKAAGYVPESRPVSCLEEVKLQSDGIDLAISEFRKFNAAGIISVESAEKSLFFLKSAVAANLRAQNFCTSEPDKTVGAITEAAGFISDLSLILIESRAKAATQPKTEE